jgi:hypothetical protein
VKLIECQRRFARMQRAGRLRLKVRIAVDGQVMDGAPTVATAMVSLSGRLAEARTDADLEEALAHAVTLFRAGVIDYRRLERRAVAIVRRLVRYVEGRACGD